MSITDPMQHPAEALREAAEWLYDVCELYEDEDLDPNDHVAVIQRAYTSSDCDDMAYMLSLMTGWQTVRMTWTFRGGFGHHTLVRSPDGRLLDVQGWTDEPSLRKRYGKAAKTARFTDVTAEPSIGFDNFDESGIEEGMVRLAGVIRSLPYSPFSDLIFKVLTGRPVIGVDLSHPDMTEHNSCPMGQGRP
jgi:hypothetical protein